MSWEEREGAFSSPTVPCGERGSCSSMMGKTTTDVLTMSMTSAGDCSLPEGLCRAGAFSPTERLPEVEEGSPLEARQSPEPAKKFGSGLERVGSKGSVDEGTRKQIKELVKNSIDRMGQAFMKDFKQQLDSLQGRVVEMQGDADLERAGLAKRLEGLKLEIRREVQRELAASRGEVDKALKATNDALQEISSCLDSSRKKSGEGRKEIEERLQSFSLENRLMIEENRKLISARRDDMLKHFGALEEKMQRADEALSAGAADSQRLSSCLASIEGKFDDVKRFVEKSSEDTEGIRVDLARLDSQATRRADFVILQASRLLRQQRDQGWVSPTFSAGGCAELRLELRCQALSLAAEALAPGLVTSRGYEYGLLLWGPEGVHVRVRLYFGMLCQEREHDFDGQTPCSLHGCGLEGSLDFATDTLALGVEVMESSSMRVGEEVRIRSRGGRGPPDPCGGDNSSSERVDELSGAFCYHRVFCPHMMCRVKTLETEWDRLRSRLIGRVEWRIEQAMMLKHCFPRGSCLCSPSFSAAGVPDLQFIFYPSGDTEARDLYCSLYIGAQSQETMQGWLSVGKCRREPLAWQNSPGMFGRVNFCMFEGSVDKGSDVLTIALDISEAQQLATTPAPATRVVPWPTLTGHGSGADNCDDEPKFSLEEVERSTAPFAEAIRSTSRLEGCGGRIGLADVKFLPPIWSPKSGIGTGKPGDADGMPEGFRAMSDFPEAEEGPKTGRVPVRPSSSPQGTTPKAAARPAPSRGHVLAAAPASARGAPLAAVAPPRRGRSQVDAAAAHGQETQVRPTTSR